MDSFYGGIPGNVPVIKVTFSSYDDMDTCFSQGATYTECFYGEYCCIDSGGDDDHGKIYRRGYGGPEYIGKFAGPKASGVKVAFTSLEELNNLLKDGSIYPIDTPDADGNTDGVYDSYGTYSSGQALTLTPAKLTVGHGLKQFDDPDAAKECNGIDYSWVSNPKVGANGQDITWFGIDLPVPYFDFNIEYIPVYDDNGQLIAKSPSVEFDESKKENKPAPFYFPYNLKLPERPKTYEITKISHCYLNDFLTSDESSYNLYYNLSYTIDSNTKKIKLNKEPATKDNMGLSIKDSENKNIYKDNPEIWYAILTDYSANLQGEKIYLYLGVYDVLQDIDKASTNTVGKGYAAITRKYSSSNNSDIMLNTSAFIAKVYDVEDRFNPFKGGNDSGSALTELNAPTERAAYLNNPAETPDYNQYHNGIIAAIHKVSANSNDKKTEYFAFDHDSEKWISLGEMGGSSQITFVSQEMPQATPFTWWDNPENGDYNTYCSPSTPISETQS